MIIVLMIFIIFLSVQKMLIRLVVIHSRFNNDNIDIIIFFHKKKLYTALVIVHYLNHHQFSI